MNIHHESLKRFVSAIFSAAGCEGREPERIAHYLVESNLVGHDSHGVIRVPAYIEWLQAGKVNPNQSMRVVFENEAIAVVDGNFGFGQVIGEQAVQLAIDKSARHGVAVMALRNCGHLGRIGDYAVLAARAGKFSLHFVNTSGAGILVAPFGGTKRRLSANPIAAGVPIPGRLPMILDISTCAIAEGKIKVALNKGVNVPDGCIIDSKGQPTNDPKVFYGNPPGAILPFGGHKGHGLSILTEMLAGALTGNACTTPDVARLSNGMLSIVLDPKFFVQNEEFACEVNRFIEFVKSSEKVSIDGEILMPGEFEDRMRAKRVSEGIDLDETTWSQILDTSRLLNMPESQVQALIYEASA